MRLPGDMIDWQNIREGIGMVVPLFSMLTASGLTFRGAQGMFEAKDAQSAMAGAARPSSNPAALAQTEKALQLQGIQAKTNYLVGQTMQANAQRMLKQHEEMRLRLMEAGAVLV
jgi:hypothetical protein